MQTYKDFKGDVDGWVKAQIDGLEKNLSGEDWNQIEKVVQRLKIQRNGNASSDYTTETERVLKKTLEGEAIVIARSMA